jgi:hypothetical protein
LERLQNYQVKVEKISDRLFKQAIIIKKRREDLIEKYNKDSQAKFAKNRTKSMAAIDGRMAPFEGSDNENKDIESLIIKNKS